MKYMLKEFEEDPTKIWESNMSLFPSSFLPNPPLSFDNSSWILDSTVEGLWLLPKLMHT